MFCIPIFPTAFRIALLDVYLVFAAVHIPSLDAILSSLPAKFQKTLQIYWVIWRHSPSQVLDGSALPKLIADHCLAAVGWNRGTFPIANKKSCKIRLRRGTFYLLPDKNSNKTEEMRQNNWSSKKRSLGCKGGVIDAAKLNRNDS